MDRSIKKCKVSLRLQVSKELPGQPCIWQIHWFISSLYKVLILGNQTSEECRHHQIGCWVVTSHLTLGFKAPRLNRAGVGFVGLSPKFGKQKWGESQRLMWLLTFVLHQYAVWCIFKQSAASLVLFLKIKGSILVSGNNA